MNLNDFLGIAIIGVVLSLFMQAIKDSTRLSVTGKKLVTVILALVLGTLYFFASQTAWWQSFLGILGVASTFYALFLKGTDFLKSE